MQVSDPTSLSTVTAQLASIKSLSGKGVSSISILSASDPRPPGCVVFPVSSALAVFLLVKGRVDIDAEIDKARRKLEKAAGFVKKQEKLLADKNWAAKAVPAVKENEAKKLKDLVKEVDGLETTVRQFEQLKLE